MILIFKKNIDMKIIYLSLTVMLFFAIHKYSDLKIAYVKAESEKLEFCEKYHKEKDLNQELNYELLMQDTVIDFLNEDNQILSSYLAEMEN